jgi:hypothetical protein
MSALLRCVAADVDVGTPREEVKYFFGIRVILRLFSDVSIWFSNRWET